MSLENYAQMKEETATIANGASQSGSIRLDGKGVMALCVRTAWTAADITFLKSTDGVNFYPWFLDDGTEVTIASANVVADRWIDLPPDTLGKGALYLLVRSGTNSAAVNQGALRTILLEVRPL